jgi:hypothetical protein
MKRRTKSRFAWPYNKNRIERITAADRLAKEAGEVAAHTSEEIAKGSDGWMSIRRAARKFERAGSLYTQSGLSAAAIAAFNGAAKCWKFAGEEGHASGCREAASSIDVFYP